MKHKHYDLLIAAANDISARFTCYQWGEDKEWDINAVTSNPQYDWKLVDKFADLKKAFAEGRVIQFKDSISDWTDCSGQPSWISYNEYRIKPEPEYETRWLWADKDGYLNTIFSKEPESMYTIRLDWSATQFPKESEL